MQDLIIEAGRTERQYWRDLWRYRELFMFLAWRDLLVRYKQTIVGATWSIVRPILTMVVLTIVFGRFAKMPSAGVPYPIFVFCALIPWQFFAAAVSECGNSLVGNSALISKVYFPRMTIPASSIITSFRSMLIFISPLPDLSLDERRPTRSAGKREELVALNGLFRPNVIIDRADTFCIDRDGTSAPFPSKLAQHAIHTASCARDIASFYSKNRFRNLRRF